MRVLIYYSFELALATKNWFVSNKLNLATADLVRQCIALSATTCFPRCKTKLVVAARQPADTNIGAASPDR